MSPCLVIPVYNHGETLPAVLAALTGLGLPCVIVDDGSDAATREAIDNAASAMPWVRVERLPRNCGRGAALRRGYESAARHGFSHVVQLDADGQHCAADVPRLLEQARVNPRALVLGEPVFDDSAPRVRRYGRQLSRWCVHVETLSFSVGDPLCGFRCVPVAAVTRLLADRPLGDRMEFDPELVVRWAWKRWPIVNVPTRVVYPAGGRSHFRPLQDNLRISWAHTRLVFGMLVRLPHLLQRGAPA